MTDRRQEAIEILEQVLSREFRLARQSKALLGPRIEDAERLYRRLAPLFEREFPEDVFEDLLGNIYFRGYKDAKDGKYMEGGRNIRPAMQRFEHLWPGQEAKGEIVRESDTAENFRESQEKHLARLRTVITLPNLIKGERYIISGPFAPIEFIAGDKITLVQIGDLNQYTAKGGCPTCGGEGAVRTDKVNVVGPVILTWGDCPACKGTGERRKGERRKDTGKRDYDRANHTKDIDGCAPQYETLKGKTLDRRLSEERRKTSGDASRPVEEAT